MLACTSVLALNEIMEKTGVRRFGLVSPYRDDVQAAIITNYGRAGYDCVAERHLGHQDNFSFSEVSADEIRQMVGDVMNVPSARRPEAVAIFCTNLRGAPLVDELEQTFGVPVYDTIATVVWQSLRLAGVDAGRLKDLGSLMAIQ
jgi:maleate isomerase